MQNIVPFEIKFATSVHGNEQRIAFLYHQVYKKTLYSCSGDRIGGLVLGARLESGRSRYEPGLGWVLSGSSHTSDLNIGIPVAPLPGAWCYRVSPETGRPGVSIL